LSNSIKNKDIKYSTNSLRYCNNVNFPKEMLSEMWENFDWQRAERKVFLWQQDLSKVALSKRIKEKERKERIKKLQAKIITSLEARALAVRRVTDQPRTSAGVDGVRWRRDDEKMQAAISLTNGIYKAQPMKRVVIMDKRGMKERRIRSSYNER